MTQVQVSKIIEAPLNDVWETVRPFDSVVDWLPWVESGFIEEGKTPDQIGAVRNLTFTDGESYRSRLLTLSDQDHFREYTILEGNMDLRNYLGRLELFECSTSGESLAVWSNQFDTNPGDRRGVCERLEEFYVSGLNNLNDLLSR